MAKGQQLRLGAVNYYLSLHAQAFISSLGRLWRNPFANLLTVAVIGIALALPAVFYLLLQNIQSLSEGWDHDTQITLFLNMDVSPAQINLLRQQLQNNNAIGKINYVSAQQGLSQFANQTGFDNVLKQLNSNPLPAVLIVQPAATMTQPLALKSLLLQLQQYPQVDSAQLDMQWVKRLYGIINLAQHCIIALALLFALTVVLIVGNTLRLSIQNCRVEIEVTKLVGATNGFIRRPFLYTGIWYGFLGALLAYIVVSLLLAWIDKPVQNLVQLYSSNYYLQGLNLFATEMLFVVGMLLGFVGAWITVGHQLRQIEPE